LVGGRWVYLSFFGGGAKIVFAWSQNTLATPLAEPKQKEQIEGTVLGVSLGHQHTLQSFKNVSLSRKLD